MKKNLLLTALASFLLAAISATAQEQPVRAGFGIGESLGFSPFWDWKTITTEHFRLSFPAELEPVARRSAELFEQTHAALAPELRWEPSLRTQIVLVNHQDSANGLTSPIQRLGIVLYVTPPESFFSTAYYDDWLKLLVIHEYTHFLNMDPTRGWVYDALRVAFGDALLPNAFWPPWLLEGYAVYMESRFTRGGRGKSPYWNMVLRAEVESGRFATSDAVTLDRVNGSHPWWPAGDVPYLYGFELVQHAAKLAPQKEKLLGDLSYASSLRVPFFLNGNLENQSGRDWYTVWEDWKTATEARAKADLATLAKTPYSKVDWLSETPAPDHFEALGSAVSPDGKWIAYSEETTANESALWIRDLATGEKRRLADKTLGVGMAFTPDSRFLVFSSLRRSGPYSNLSEVGFVRVSDGKVRWISSGLRARDPDVSRDGQRILFARADGAGVGLAEADLIAEEDELRLGEARWLWRGGAFDRVSNPKYSLDGKHAIFSLHVNGKPQSDLMALDLSDVAPPQSYPPPRTLLADGRFNRFPAVHPKTGDIYLVSDRTGTDLVYRLGNPSARVANPVPVTHLSTGAWLPSFAPDGTLYASVYSASGWRLARVEMKPEGYSPAALTIARPEGPAVSPDAEKIGGSTSAELKVEDYSVFPSLWPRQWAPILFAGSEGNWAFGGSVLGYDATDRHRYVVGGFYDTLTRHIDWLALYSNRSFGPNLTFMTTGNHQYLNTTRTLLEQDITAQVMIDYPLPFTRWTLVPQLYVTSERITNFRVSSAAVLGERSRDQLTDLSARVIYYDEEAPRLAIASERGRTASIGGRSYFYAGQTINAKLVATYSENLRLFEHWALELSAQYSHAVRFQTRALAANTVYDGGTRAILSNLATDPLKEFRLRGYGSSRIYTRSGGMFGSELKFPLLRVFRGWGTNPVFLEQFTGYAFLESPYFPNPIGSKHFLPSAGGGIRANLDLFVNLPIQASFNYERGLDSAFSPGGEFYFLLGLPALPI